MPSPVSHGRKEEEMTEAMPHFARIVVLLFLGAIFLTGVSLLVLLYGAACFSKRLAGIGGGCALIFAGCYALLLFGASLASSEKDLPPGGWKYFCEIDCHIGYSVSGVQTASVIGPETHQVAAHGKFVVVRLKVWFDEHTISPRRGNGPLTPNPRRVDLVDADGVKYDPSPEGEAEFARVSGEQTPLTQALRPGESFVTSIVFEVPKRARGLRFLITEDDPESHFLIGHENSPWHKKTYLALTHLPISPVESAIYRQSDKPHAHLRSRLP
jgi:hypothetical protein